MKEYFFYSGTIDECSNWRHTQNTGRPGDKGVFKPLGKRLLRALQAKTSIKERLHHILPSTLLNAYCKDKQMCDLLYAIFSTV